MREGHARAQHDMAVLLQHGLGIPKDAKAAFELLKQSSMQDFAPAITMLASCHLKGEGTMASVRQAVKLYTRAVRDHRFLGAYIGLADIFANGGDGLKPIASRLFDFGVKLLLSETPIR